MKEEKSVLGMRLTMAGPKMGRSRWDKGMVGLSVALGWSHFLLAGMEEGVALPIVHVVLGLLWCGCAVAWWRRGESRLLHFPLMSLDQAESLRDAIEEAVEKFRVEKETYEGNKGGE